MALSLRRQHFEDVPEQEPSEQRIFVPSVEQQNAFDWVKNGRGNGFWSAVAGAGKTTTIEHASAMMGGYISICSYNKRIADEIKGRINARPTIEGQNIQVGTIHSFGLRSWSRVAPHCRVEGPLDPHCRDPRWQKYGMLKFDKVWDILTGSEPLERPMFSDGSWLQTEQVPYRYRQFTRRLIQLAKSYALGIDWPVDSHGDRFIVDGGNGDWEGIVDKFQLADELAEGGEFMDGGESRMVETGIRLAQKGLRIGREISDVVIDHADMVYMALSTRCRVFQCNWVFVDEAQDLSLDRILFVRKMVKSTGRSIWVGDPCQSIYGYSGVDSDAIHRIKQMFSCTDVPLNRTFRCPKSVVTEAQKYVGHIYADESAPEGEVVTIDKAEFLRTAHGGELSQTGKDIIICRYNAPLVELAYDLIKRGVPCYVEGRNIGTEITSLAERWKVVSLDLLKERVKAYRTKAVSVLLAKGQESAAESLSDRVETLVCLIDGMPKGATIVDLKTRITSMFQDSEGNRKVCLTLSSVHKAKGREWNTVYLYGKNVFMPSKWAKQGWQMDQETNIIYVAITRAKRKLVYVDLPKKAVE